MLSTYFKDVIFQPKSQGFIEVKDCAAILPRFTARLWILSINFPYLGIGSIEMMPASGLSELLICSRLFPGHGKILLLSFFFFLTRDRKMCVLETG